MHEPLISLFESWYVTPLESPRSRPAAQLAGYLAGQGERVHECNSIAEAIARALDDSDVDTEIVIFGSFFSVAAAILWLSETSGVLIDG